MFDLGSRGTTVRYQWRAAVRREYLSCVCVCRNKILANSSRSGSKISYQSLQRIALKTKKGLTQSIMDSGGMPTARPAWAEATGPGALAGGISRLGPQAERSSAWVNRAGEVKAPTQREVCFPASMIVGGVGCFREPSCCMFVHHQQRWCFRMSVHSEWEARYHADASFTGRLGGDDRRKQSSRYLIFSSCFLKTRQALI